MTLPQESSVQKKRPFKETDSYSTNLTKSLKTDNNSKYSYINRLTHTQEAATSQNKDLKDTDYGSDSGSITPATPISIYDNLGCNVSFNYKKCKYGMKNQYDISDTKKEEYKYHVTRFAINANNQSIELHNSELQMETKPENIHKLLNYSLSIKTPNIQDIRKKGEELLTEVEKTNVQNAISFLSDEEDQKVVLVDMFVRKNDIIVTKKFQKILIKEDEIPSQEVPTQEMLIEDDETLSQETLIEEDEIPSQEVPTQKIFSQEVNIPKIHTVVLYKQDDKYLVIDPNNSSFSNILIGAGSNIWACCTSRVKIYSSPEKKIAVTDNQWRDCIDISVKLAFHLIVNDQDINLKNKQGKINEYHIPKESLKDNDSIKEITNQSKVCRYLPDILEKLPFQIKQSSNVPNNKKICAYIKNIDSNFEKLKEKGATDIIASYRNKYEELYRKIDKEPSNAINSMEGFCIEFSIPPPQIQGDHISLIGEI